MESMGHVRVPVTLSGPSGRSETLTMLVDTGSTYTWVPQTVLASLGVAPLRPHRFQLGDGRIVERQLGEAVAEVMGTRTTTIVVFALEGDATVLGVYALEGLALEVDPAHETLRPMDHLLFMAAA